VEVSEKSIVNAFDTAGFDQLRLLEAYKEVRIFGFIGKVILFAMKQGNNRVVFAGRQSTFIST